MGFDNMGPETQYNVTITPVAYDNTPIDKATAVSSVLTKSRSNKLLATVSSVGSRHIILSWKTWPSDVLGASFTLYQGYKIIQKRMVTRRSSHRNLMFIGLVSDVEYRIEAVSVLGEVVFETTVNTKPPKVTRSRSTRTELLNTPTESEKDEEQVMLPPSGVKATSTQPHQVTIEWSRPPALSPLTRVPGRSVQTRQDASRQAGPQYQKDQSNVQGCATG